MDLFKIVMMMILITAQNCLGQIPGGSIMFGKEYSKEISLYKAKIFVIREVLGSSSTPVKFEIDPLASASSGELTSLVYQSSNQNKEGMVLGFYGTYWKESGVIFQGYAFKDLTKDKALDVMNTVEKNLSEAKKYLAEDYNNNNIYFQYDDITFLLYVGPMGSTKIRVFWNEFDAEWDLIAFKRTKRRLEKKLD